MGAVDVDGGDVDVGYAGGVGEEGEERDEGVVVGVGLVVVDYARLLLLGGEIVGRGWAAHCIVSSARGESFSGWERQIG